MLDKLAEHEQIKHSKALLECKNRIVPHLKA